MRKEKNKVKKIILILIACLLFAGGVFCVIFFALKSDKIRYYEVKLNDQTSEIVLSTSSSSLSPNDNMISKVVKFALDKSSVDSFVRAKIVFENYSDDSRVLSFVSQLNFNVKNIECYSNEKYNWIYFEEDNAFYLMNKSEALRTVSSGDGSYVFIEKLIVPNTIEQMSTLNADGENVQIGEDVKIHIIFEAIQSQLPAKKYDIENLRPYFNLNATNYENGYTCENGFITNCNLTAETLILPKKIGNDYVLGIKANAFQNTNLKQIIIPASYIYFKENAFYNLTNLNFVAIKNQINFTFQNNSFNTGIVEIYLPKTSLKKLEKDYSGLPYYNNFKQIYEITSSDITNIPATTKYVYSDSLTTFEGKLESISGLKVADFPVLETINDEMFAKLNNLVCVECPNAVVVGKKAFNNCQKLISVSLAKNVTEIGEAGFYGCSSLKDASFVKNLQIISKETFRGCVGLTEISFEADNLQIKNSAFFGCTSLRTVNIKNLSLCENYAFAECPSLRWLVVREVSELNIEEKALSKPSGEANMNMFCVFVSENVKNEFSTKYPQISDQIVLLSINNGELSKFEGNIKNLDLTDFNKIETITKIGNNVFKDNKTLISITLPYSVKQLGDNVFDGATNLTKIIIDSYQTLELSEKTFENINEDLHIFVNESVLEVFKQTYSGLDLKFVSK